MPRATSPPADRVPPREIELKLAVSARDLASLRHRLDRIGAGEAVAVDNVYFDTAEQLLRSRRMALRVRKIGRRWLQTLKAETAAGALSARGEWEVPAPRGKLDLLRFPPTPLAALLDAHPQAKLQAVFRTRFMRTIRHANDGAIEVALDEGEIVAGGRSEPILELELELKSGPADALFRLALDLAGKGSAALALRPAVESKAMRGYRLAAGQAPQPAKANARAVTGTLARDTTLAEALRAVVERGTTLLLANAAAVDAGADPEFIHQARVAVRRARSAARLLGKEAGWPAALDGELRWIARRLGAARDWDVLQEQTLPSLIEAHPETAPMSAPATRLRRRADEQLRRALAGARFARLALRLLRWAASAPGADTATLAEAASRRLARLHRRLFGSAAFFVALPIEEQHRVRIRAKRLRYALDLFAAALPAKANARYVEQLARLQDELGALNDAVVAAHGLPRLARAAAIDAAPALAWLDGRRQLHALKAEAALAALQRLPCPWQER
jgi:triphosphatase